MNPEGIKERFELYRKWLKALLVKEFLNLPTKHQERFIAVIEKFLQDCRRLHEEGKEIKEKPVKVVVEKVLPPDNKEEEYNVLGRIGSQQVKMRLPATKPVPEVGTRINHVLFSTDGEMWYSSKTELITGRKQ